MVRGMLAGDTVRSFDFQEDQERTLAELWVDRLEVLGDFGVVAPMLLIERICVYLSYVI